MSDSNLLDISPHFIVRSYRESVDYYRDKLGFKAMLEVPESDPFFALVVRGGASIALKEIAPEVGPMPNHTRHQYARLDAFISTSDPDALYEEYVDSGATIHRPLANTDDGLRAFEIRDINGYVLGFGRPCDGSR